MKGYWKMRFQLIVDDSACEVIETSDISTTGLNVSFNSSLNESGEPLSLASSGMLAYITNDTQYNYVSRSTNWNISFYSTW